jgi:hypothetical protein
MCVVMPSIKLDGTAASITQRKRRPFVISSDATEKAGSAARAPAPLGCIFGCPDFMPVDGAAGAGADAVMPVCVSAGVVGGAAIAGSGFGAITGLTVASLAPKTIAAHAKTPTIKTP